MARRAADAEADESGPDPLTDLFFTMAAVVIAILAALAPTLHAARDVAGAPEIIADRMADGGRPIMVDGRDAQVLVATRDGVRLGGALVDRAALADDPRIAAALADTNARPILLVIAPDGQESAFLFDLAAGRFGTTGIWQVRLDRFCGFAGSATARDLCRPGSGDAEPRP